MGDVTDDDAKVGTIVYVNRFFAPNYEEKSMDIELDEVSVSDACAAEHDATLVIVNGLASADAAPASAWRQPLRLAFWGS